jgi:hypothetical protein
MHYYENNGIKQFASQMGITSAINSEQIILGVSGDYRINHFISSVNGLVIDMSKMSRIETILDELHEIVLKIPSNLWKRVSKISMSRPDGLPIEYTSSSHASLAMWTIDNAKKGKSSKLSQQPNKLLSMVTELEGMISENISNFVHNSTSHVVRLQPGALRSMPGTVPQRAHRDFKMKTYNERFPGQVYIGFMPVTRDGMFLQVWNGPGESKLVFVPYGTFLLLPGNTIHAGWMCTSPLHHNYRLHFYIIVSKEPHKLNRKEDLVFENMNTYEDEESPEKKELFKSHLNCLSKQINKYGF